MLLIETLLIDVEILQGFRKTRWKIIWKVGMTMFIGEKSTKKICKNVRIEIKEKCRWGWVLLSFDFFQRYNASYRGSGAVVVAQSSVGRDYVEK